MLNMLLNGETGTPFSRAELEAAFRLVEDPTNWKNPIRARIDSGEDMDAIREAIIFYTGSVPTFVTVGQFTLVSASGYYAAIGS